ncbi:AraC family transcriptional regulator [Leclercia adecarboxylata]|uniref:helix-turn-helix domain-containing protein n=1 Tax=Leclercia TaxID=83654 RepID=UPI000CD0A9CB|nr:MULTISPECIES: AraC family transcriptional regulator [Leclercia]POV33033.1 AraC family transcriptional regulator [Leclercia sp. LSNIH5]POW64842.1 AraC family transcriptional regulator [Leclercia sp. LSNIH2]HCH40219.1 AraC family transcriptional regulator [Enterobacter sp.]AUU83643.1 AraC family transcriptional regulator [Leclercia sp. LSNIH1]MEB5750536.1 AraC family transcriptional regulator [Leclercia adecarboxylata]
MTQRTSAETFEEYIPGELQKEHRALSSRDVFVQILTRRQVQEKIIIPAVPEPFIVWILSGCALVEERSPGEGWIANPVVAGDFFLTTADSPTEMRWRAEPGAPFIVMHVYIGVAMMQGVELREVSGERDETLSALLEHIRAELYQQNQPSGPFIQGIAQALAVHLARTYRTDAKRHRGGLQAFKLHRVFKAMRDDLAQPFDLARLACLTGLSEFHFSRVFKQSTGLSPSHYFIRLRMEEARRLLSETDDSIISISLTVGYNSPSHFASAFRRVTGISPSKYRSDYRRSKITTV